MKFKQIAFKLVVTAVLLIASIICLAVFFREITGSLLYVLKLFLPFIVAFIISLAANPLAEKLQKKFKLPKGLTAILVIVLIVGIVGGALTGIIWKIVSEIKSIYLQIPDIYDMISETFEKISRNLSRIYEALPLDVQAVFDSIGQNFEQTVSKVINENYKPVMMGAGNIAKALPSIFVGIIVFILSLFFMISNGIDVKKITRKVMPKAMYEKVIVVTKQIKKYLGGYVKAQLIIMSISFILIFIGMTVLKVPYAMLIAFGVAIFDALPFFGSGAVLIPWSIISFVSSDIRMGIGMLIIYLAVIFTRQMVEPKIVSTNIGINPLLTLVSMYIGFRIFSIGGMIFGPVILMIIVSFYKAGAFDSLIELVKNIFMFIKRQVKDLYNYLAMK